MPKILWVSPYSLHDVSSGASIHCRYILESLLKYGFEIWAFSSFVFDRPHGGQATFGNLTEFFERNPQIRIFTLQDRGINYYYLKSLHTVEMQRTCEEQNEFFEQYTKILELYKPDIVLGYGTGMDSYTCFAEAKRRGIATMYLLLNGKHGHFAFPNIDLVVTDSQTTSEYYAVNYGINCVSIGQFIDPKVVVAPVANRNQSFVTMVNPDFSKGMAIVAKLAKLCQKELPELKFLIINSRANFAANVPLLHTKGNKDEHPFNERDFPNVLMSNLVTDMRVVYANTRVLLAPSLTYESWGRVVSEALLNDIPVLTHNVGGLAESLQGGGIALDPPQHCIEDNLSLPSDEEAQVYLDALKRLLNESWHEKIAQARKNVDINYLSANLSMILRGLITRNQDNLQRNTLSLYQ